MQRYVAVTLPVRRIIYSVSLSIHYYIIQNFGCQLFFVILRNLSFFVEMAFFYFAFFYAKYIILRKRKKTAAFFATAFFIFLQKYPPIGRLSYS